MANTRKKAPVTTVDVSDVVAETSTQKVDLTQTTEGTIALSDYALINVKSNVVGGLIYVNPKNGMKTYWGMCGEIQQMSLGDLREMKASSIAFFQNQWVIITGFADENAEKYKPADIYKALFITQYYKNMIDPSNYDEICSWSPSEIREKVSLLSDGAKDNLAVALSTYVKKGLLDSRKSIKAFEEALGCTLDEE